MNTAQKRKGWNAAIELAHRAASGDTVAGRGAFIGEVLEAVGHRRDLALVEAIGEVPLVVQAFNASGLGRSDPDPGLLVGTFVDAVLVTCELLDRPDPIKRQVSLLASYIGDEFASFEGRHMIDSPVKRLEAAERLLAFITARQDVFGSDDLADLSGTVCTGHLRDINGRKAVVHDGDTCPVHEDPILFGQRRCPRCSGKGSIGGTTMQANDIEVACPRCQSLGVIDDTVDVSMPVTLTLTINLQTKAMSSYVETPNVGNGQLHTVASGDDYDDARNKAALEIAEAATWPTPELRG